MPPPRRGGIKRWSASVVRLSVCLMSRTSALTRKPKGPGRRNFAQGYPRLHATPTQTSRSKGQKSRWGGGILWRPPSRTACYSKSLLIKLSHSSRCVYMLPTTGTSSDQQKIVTCYQCVTEHRVVNIMVVTVWYDHWSSQTRLVLVGVVGCCDTLC